MTPTQTRVVLASCLLLTAGVALNATVLQSDTRAGAAARLAAERTEAQRRQRLALDLPVPGERTMLPTPPVPQRLAAADAYRPPTREETAIRFARLRPDSARTEALPYAPDAEGNPETIRAVTWPLDLRVGRIH